jgi:Dictyostelium (slime mold) repeat/Regulator of chromosome condensation (RCC1) repeat
MRRLLLPTVLVLLASCSEGTLVGIAGRLSADPEALDFGTVKVMQKAARDVRIENTGRRSLQVSLSVEGEGFSLSRDGLELSPSQTATVSIGFRVKTAGRFEGRLVAESADSSIEVMLLAQTEACGVLSGCVESRFDEEAGECVQYELADGTACSSACLDAGVCESGTCVDGPGSEAVDCSDEDACTNDRCDDRLGCVHEPVHCDDGNSCTRDSCSPGVGCVNEDVSSSCSTENPCAAAICDAQLGCQLVSVADGTPCGPASCREARVCESGACVQSPGPAGTCGCDDTRPIRTLSLGSYHSCRITPAKTVECWGGNEYGQLGDGTTTTWSTSPTQVVGLADVEEVSAAAVSTCARRTNGEVYCWGDNREGYLLGPDAVEVVTTPMLVTGIPPAVSVSNGHYRVCIAATDGSVWCWGPFFGELPISSGPENFRSPFQVTGISSAISVSVGNQHICVLLQDRTIRCWGRTSHPWWEDGGTAPVPTPGLLPDGGVLHGVVELQANHFKTCVRTRFGEVRCTGGYTDPPEVRSTYLEPGEWFGRIGLPGCAKQLGGTYDGHFCARLEGDAAACWYHANRYGELGTGDTNVPPSYMSDVSGLREVQEIATSLHSHSCAILGDGGYVCWGYNGYGQLGDGTTTHKYAP